MADHFLQDADSITVVLDDGFNLVQYAFKLRSSGPRQTLVECQVGHANSIDFPTMCSLLPCPLVVVMHISRSCTLQMLM